MYVCGNVGGTTLSTIRTFCETVRCAYSHIFHKFREFEYMYGEDEYGNSEHDANFMWKLQEQGGSRIDRSGPANDVFGTLILTLL